MLRFPDGLFTDVRIERVYTSLLMFQNQKLTGKKEKTEVGATVRVYDGKRWYYHATTDAEDIQRAVDETAAMAAKNPDIASDPALSRFEINRGRLMRYEENDVSRVSLDEKEAALSQYLDIAGREPVRSSKFSYRDRHCEKHIMNSLGTDVTFDIQNAAICCYWSLQEGEAPPQDGRASVGGTSFADVLNKREEIERQYGRDLDYMRNAVPVAPGTYTCVMSPNVVGVFAHESFGHKSESDFMVGDETMMREWEIGKRVGAPLLSIIDSGLIEGAGYVPFDDEGTRAKKNYLIKNGVLCGRLHSAVTAAALNEEVTGNARAMSFVYEPLVRMTTTYIEAGEMTKEELFSGVEEGVYLETYVHGSGMTTFTIAPGRAYMIRGGRVAEPVRVAVITGNVMTALHDITGLSNEVELDTVETAGGCGKMEQWPLPIGHGGPYMRVGGITVQ